MTKFDLKFDKVAFEIPKPSSIILILRLDRVSVSSMVILDALASAELLIKFERIRVRTRAVTRGKDLPPGNDDAGARFTRLEAMEAFDLNRASEKNGIFSDRNAVDDGVRRR